MAPRPKHRQLKIMYVPYYFLFSCVCELVCVLERVSSVVVCKFLSGVDRHPSKQSQENVIVDDGMLLFCSIMLVERRDCNHCLNVFLTWILLEVDFYFSTLFTLILYLNWSDEI